MKTLSNTRSRSGFTLMELMVAMAITTIIVTVLVSITSIAIDTWNRSRAELRASRQAKSMVDTIARDFEALVTRRGNLNEWLSATSPGTQPGDKLISSNSSNLVFFSGSTDRYNGEIGGDSDMGGDVSCVGYRLEYRDPIASAGAFKTFVLNRILVNPDETFRDLLGKPDLAAAFSTYSAKISEPQNFVCENVYQFTVTFHVEVIPPATGTTVSLPETRPVTIGESGSSQVTKSFKIKGTGIETAPTTSDEIKAGKVKAVEIALTVISDTGIDQLRTRSFNDSQKAEFLSKNSYQYSKVVQLPGM
jgi:prepilin-type N-terminal cleavage/methylation domain-containing protein